jgi:hypothetical protein
MSHRPFKDRVYHQFARIGQALASEKRLEIIDLLASRPAMSRPWLRNRAIRG